MGRGEWAGPSGTGLFLFPHPGLSGYRGAWRRQGIIAPHARRHLRRIPVAHVRAAVVVAAGLRAGERRLHAAGETRPPSPPDAPHALGAPRAGGLLPPRTSAETERPRGGERAARRADRAAGERAHAPLLALRAHRRTVRDRRGG